MRSQAFMEYMNSLVIYKTKNIWLYPGGEDEEVFLRVNFQACISYANQVSEQRKWDFRKLIIEKTLGIEA